MVNYKGPNLTKIMHSPFKTPNLISDVNQKIIHFEILLDSSTHVPAGTQMNVYQVYQDKEGITSV